MAFKTLIKANKQKYKVDQIWSLCLHPTLTLSPSSLSLSLPLSLFYLFSLYLLSLCLLSLLSLSLFSLSLLFSFSISSLFISALSFFSISALSSLSVSLSLLLSLSLLSDYNGTLPSWRWAVRRNLALPGAGIPTVFQDACEAGQQTGPWLPGLLCWSRGSTG